MPRQTPAVAALVLLAAFAPAASAAPRPRTDLKITAGDVTVAGARVTGSFAVRNTGTRKARATSTAVKVDGRRVRSVATGLVAPGRQVVVSFSARVGGGTHVISVCADRRDQVRERKEGNNCRKLGTVTLASTSVPTDPLDYDPGSIVKVGTSPHEYWMRVPTAYDDSHQTPIRMVVFVHGCGGVAQTEATWIDTYITNADDYLLMTPGLGKDGQCWDTDADAGPLLDAIADAKTHFNIDPKRVVIGGYSSGSGLAGAVAFAHAELFAGLYLLPGRPWWSNDDRAAMMAGAAWKLNIAWRPHTSDEYYDIAAIRADKRALIDAGWPLSFNEVAGSHAYTQDDFTYAFDKADGWVAP